MVHVFVQDFLGSQVGLVYFYVENSMAHHWYRTIEVEFMPITKQKVANNAGLFAFLIG